MKTRILTLAVTVATLSLAPAPLVAADDVSDYEASMRAMMAAIRKDKAWKPACKEAGVITVGETNKAGGLRSFCVEPDGSVLACYGGTWNTYEMPVGAKEPKITMIEKPSELRRYSPDGKLTATLTAPFTPQVICRGPDGSLFVGGDGKVCRMDKNGKVLATVDSPALAGAKEMVVGGKKRALRKDITGLGFNGKDLYMACASPSDYTYMVYRMDADLKNPKEIIKKLAGCCGQMDVQAAPDGCWVPHNARHSIEHYDREGKLLSKFGKKSEKAADCFGGCCEPKNLRIAANGDVYAAESGPPTCIKRFSPSGKFLGVIALPSYESGCVRVTLDVSPDGKRFYLLNAGADTIHVFAP